jgi:hypothetical protein
VSTKEDPRRQGISARDDIEQLAAWARGILHLGRPAGGAKFGKYPGPCARMRGRSRRAWPERNLLSDGCKRTLAIECHRSPGIGSESNRPATNNTSDKQNQN